MSRSGKTLTVFVIVFFLLLLSLTSIVTFFLIKEKETHQATQQELAVSETNRSKLEAELKAAQEEIVVAQNKLKEQDDKISGLLDDLDLEKGLREESKKENAALKSQVDTISAERKSFQDEVIDLREKNASLQDELASAQEARDQMASELKEAQAKLKDLENQLSSITAINLDKIIVTPQGSEGQIQSGVGQILKINEDNNFAIIDLGSSDGVRENIAVEFYRAETLLGEGKITRVQNIMSVVDLLPPLSANKLRLSDRATIKK